MVLAGEASGDEHAARVVAALKARWPRSRFLGIGGQRMKNQGVELYAELDGLAVMGLAEVIPRLPFLYRLSKRLVSLLDSGDVDLVIPVDYSGIEITKVSLLLKLLDYFDQLLFRNARAARLKTLV